MKLWLALCLLVAVCTWGGETYLVVDLSGGVEAERFGVRYCDVAPDVSNDVCRTSELWLRLVPAGSFVMGSPVGELGRQDREDLHEVTLSKPFYIGVFEVTQRQWELVLGVGGFGKDTQPMASIAYRDVRGSVDGTQWPADNRVDGESFMGVLRRKTGLVFDLPTEAQWEYACRAGMSTALNSGKNLTDVKQCPNVAELGRYAHNREDGRGRGYYTTTVGMYLPNAWGLYDMHGNVREMCLDWHKENLGKRAVVDPVGPVFGTQRVTRGGSGSNYGDASNCRSAERYAYGGPGYTDSCVGLRVCVQPQEMNVAPVQMEAVRTDAGVNATESGKSYAVVDLSGGAGVEAYPVRYSAMPPDLNNGRCRTSELWLRLIPAGSFMMGSPTNERGHQVDEVLHGVTLNKAFYMGVFEVTQGQWELVMGDTFAAERGDDAWPMTWVSYPMIRGSSGGAQWPAGNSVDAVSFMGRLRLKTAWAFDLPTEAQWEYACRAGTTTALNNGKDLTSIEKCLNLPEVGRHYFNQRDGKGGYARYTRVGMYRPNAWGLYDMHGNVYEWCLDWWQTNLTAGAVSDPVGPAEGTARILRGGGRDSGGGDCRSAYRTGWPSQCAGPSVGLRVCALPPGEVAAPVRREPARREACVKLEEAASSYLIVDLSGGTNAASYPVRYSATPPDLKDDSCRTSNLWLRLVPAGSFMMGSPADEAGRCGNEDLHQVTLTKPFYMGVFEVTQKQWELVVGDRPATQQGDLRPVECMTYHNVRGDSDWEYWEGEASRYATSFMGVLRAKTDLAFDLPTEAQWEYACRAGTRTAFNNGKNLSGADKCANLAELGRYVDSAEEDQDEYLKYATVGQYLPNAWGLYDMHGNVEEWCVDRYQPSLGTNAVVDPKGPLFGKERVLRGGGHNCYARYCRSAVRDSCAPNRERLIGYGFRVYLPVNAVP